MSASISRNPVLFSSHENLWTPAQKPCRGDESEFITRAFVIIYQVPVQLDMGARQDSLLSKTHLFSLTRLIYDALRPTTAGANM